jgi:hypothetical protein
VLLEWMSAREAHLPGSVLTDRHFLESLTDLALRRIPYRRALRGGRQGEGRAAFVARTGGASGSAAARSASV